MAAFSRAAGPCPFDGRHGVRSPAPRPPASLRRCAQSHQIIHLACAPIRARERVRIHPAGSRRHRVVEAISTCAAAISRRNAGLTERPPREPRPCIATSIRLKSPPGRSRRSPSVIIRWCRRPTSGGRMRTGQGHHDAADDRALRDTTRRRGARRSLSSSAAMSSNRPYMASTAVPPQR